MYIKEVGIQTQGDVDAKYIDEEDKTSCLNISKTNLKISTNFWLHSYFNLDSKVVEKLQLKGSLASKMTLLNSFKDHEVLNAFKLALINSDHSHNPLEEDEFYQNLGENFISLLRKIPDPPSNDLERKLSEMNIHSESYTETARISDFGDIIPVDMEFESKNTRKHQKWSLAEQKKLTSLLNNRNLLEISKEEWEEIATKLDRTYASVIHKSEEIFGKIKNKNKKRKVLENPPALMNMENAPLMPFDRVNNDPLSSFFCKDIDSQTD